MKALAIAFAAVLAVSGFSFESNAQGRPPVVVVPGGGPMIHPPAPNSASANARAIFNALNVDERAFSMWGSETVTKQIGGLACTESRGSGPTRIFPLYECNLGTGAFRKDERIYAALNVAARRQYEPMLDRWGRPVVDHSGNPVMARIVDTKIVGNLQCTEARPTVPGDDMRYSCELL